MTITVPQESRLTDEQTANFKAQLTRMLDEEGADLDALADRLGYKDADEMRKATAPSVYIARSKYEALKGMAPRERRSSDRAASTLKNAYECISNARKACEELGLGELAADIAVPEAELRGAVLFAELTSGQKPS